MPDLARRVGLGLASRGSVDDCVEWAERARAAGIESVWFHDSYFERDAVTYASAVASRVGEIGVGLGALNPFTRHPVLIAMTISALDEMAPGRIRLGLGSALPLRLVDETRHDALNRAKREAFVIYMMSILSDVTLKRAGFEAELRDRIAAAWRAEDYTTAGRLIPDDLLDAFILCGTRREVAEQ